MMKRVFSFLALSLLVLALNACVKRQIQVPTMTPPYVQSSGYGYGGAK